MPGKKKKDTELLIALIFNTFCQFTQTLEKPVYNFTLRLVLGSWTIFN